MKHGAAKKTPWIGVGIGVMISLVTAVLLSGILAWLISSEKLPQSATETGSVFIQGIAVLLSILIATKLTQGKRLVISMITGGALLIVLTAIGMLFGNGTLKGVGSLLVLVMVGALLPAIGNLKQKKTVKARKLKYKTG